MTKTKRRLIQMASICLVFVMLLGLSIQPTYADYGGWGPVTHSGKYYFKYNHGNNRLYVSTKKTKGYKKTTVNSSLFATNGKEVMYVGKSGSRYYVKAYVISSRRTRKVKRLPKADYWFVCAARGHYLWLEGNEKTYRYNISTRKLVLVKKNASLQHLKDSYYLCNYGPDTEIYSQVETNFGYVTVYERNAAIYQATKDGKLKLKKSLGKISDYDTRPVSTVSNEGKFRKVYYVTSDGHEVRCVDYNGYNDKEIVYFENGGIVYSVNGYSCYVAIDGTSYRYDYETGEMTESDY